MDGRNFDAAAVRSFSPVLAEDGGGQPVVVDLTAVEFADTSGLGALCRLTGRPEVIGVAGVTPRLARCLKRVPPHRLPRSYACVGEAIAARPDRSPPRPSAIVRTGLQPAAAG